uniref:Uncharacterized protein n=1 Tax=Anguilla anguilla TaxID=7936 RepID=A0A0E9PID7_ANGAN
MFFCIRYFGLLCPELESD